MSNSPYFSVIVPVYNVERYVKICINSILHQTFRDFELIIVDDASTDNSYKICEELCNGDKRVRLFRHEKNLGQSSARNLGLSQARGEYIWFIDSDDAIFSHAFERLYKVTQAERGGVDAVHLKGNYTTTQDDDKPLNVKRIYLHWEGNNSVGFLTDNISRRLSENWATTRIYGVPFNTICKRELLSENEICFPKNHCYTEDQVFNIAVMCFAKKYLMLREAVYVYRVRAGSSSHKADFSMGWKSLFIIAEEMNKIFAQIPELDGDRILKEQCIISTWEALFLAYIRPFYDGKNISTELDKAVYDVMLPLFGENTALVKYFFHGFNQMWRQANIFAGQRNYLLRERNALIQWQEKLIEQMTELLEQQRRQLQQLKGK